MHTTSTTSRSRGRAGTGGWWRAEGATIAQPRRRAVARRAFTLTELLIVIGLIVLVIALAVPAFRAMSGGRSVDAAVNQLSAVLGAARAEAIGLQKVRGVFFYLDSGTNRVSAALVQQSESALPADVGNPPELFLDLVPGRDPIVLPVGVGLQGIDNADVAGSSGRKDDGYIGFNVFDDRPVRYGGVILFDGYGRVINKQYGFLLSEPTGKRMEATPTRLAEAWGYSPSDPPPATYMVARRGKNDPPPTSLFGFVLYDAETFGGAVPEPGDDRGLAGDPQPTGGNYDQDEKDEEAWLDQNAVPILINRYNGTLIRGE